MTPSSDRDYEAVRRLTRRSPTPSDSGFVAESVGEDTRVDHVDVAPEKILEFMPERELIIESPTDATSSSDHHIDVRVRPEVGIDRRAKDPDLLESEASGDPRQAVQAAGRLSGRDYLRTVDGAPSPISVFRRYLVTGLSTYLYRVTDSTQHRTTATTASR